MGIGSAKGSALVSPSPLQIIKGAVMHLIAMQQEEKAAVVCIREAVYTGITIFDCGCLRLMRVQRGVKHLVALVATNASRERARR